MGSWRQLFALNYYVVKFIFGAALTLTNIQLLIRIQQLLGRL